MPPASPPNTPDARLAARVRAGDADTALLQNGHASDAIALLKLNVELFPASAAARSALGRAYEVAGLRTEALASARRALALDPTHTRALELLRRTGG